MPKPAKAKGQRKVTPPVRLIVGSFVLVILLGTALLTMPFSAASGTFTNPLDALFTATSATCVTGLSVVDTTAHWSVFGQGVLLIVYDPADIPGFLSDIEAMALPDRDSFGIVPLDGE